MKKAIFSVLLGLAVPASASWKGKLDLLSVPSPVILRELHDGQWLAGVARPNLWHLDYTSDKAASPWNGQRFHVGVFEAWNAEHGNPSTGLIAGVDVPAPLAAAIAAALPSFWKPGAYMSAAVALDSFVGYRPAHSADVNGPLIYGAGAELKIKFGIKELQNGL